MTIARQISDLSRFYRQILFIVGNLVVIQMDKNDLEKVFASNPSFAASNHKKPL